MVAHLPLRRFVAVPLVTGASVKLPLQRGDLLDEGLVPIVLSLLLKGQELDVDLAVEPRGEPEKVLLEARKLGVEPAAELAEGQVVGHPLPPILV